MTENGLPTSASVVVIGGGIIGCNVLYHLAKAGIGDAVLIERAELTAGTTWHSAAVVPLVRSTRSMTKLAQYSAQLYASLEEETGQATGWRVVGQIDTAPSSDWLDAIKHKISMARAYGVDAHLINPDEAGELLPMLRTDDLKGAAWFPETGRVNPSDVCQALAKGARAHGARIFQGIEVIGFEITRGTISTVHTSAGSIRCEAVVNCAGIWGWKVAAMAGVAAPLFACEHIYAITESMGGIEPTLTNLRSEYLYAREEVGGLMVGFFEPNPKPLPLDRLPSDQAFIQMPEDVDHFVPLLEQAVHRIPALEDVGFKMLFSGPESFTPDHEPLLGEAPEVRGFYLACAMNSSGVLLGGGVGWAMAEWVRTGQAPTDLTVADIKRFGQYDNNSRTLAKRIPEVLASTFEIQWPHYQYKTVRKIRRSPFYSQLADKGAHFGQKAMWERPSWFAPAGEDPAATSSFGRPNWLPWSAAEHKAARESVTMFDQSPFAKLLVQGPDAEPFLNRLCSNNMAVEVGRVVYTAMLNTNGGIESDLTVTRLAEDEYLVVTGSGQRISDLSWLRRHRSDDEFVVLTDVTAAWSVLVLAGPKARQLLSRLTPSDLGNTAFPFRTSAEIELGYGYVRATRVSFHGELGYELYVPTDFSAKAFDEIVEVGQPDDLRLAGAFALESLRIEKAFRSWGHDIGPTDTPLEAGLGFAVKLDTNIDFIGKEALLRQREQGLTRRLVSFVFQDPDAYPVGSHPIYRDGEVCGYTTSNAFGHTLGSAVSLGWVEGREVTPAALQARDFEIEIATERFSATASLCAAYDPEGIRMRA